MKNYYFPLIKYLVIANSITNGFASKYFSNKKLWESLNKILKIILFSPLKIASGG